MPRIAANGIRLHYITTGEGPDVVLIHGFLSNLSAWHLRAVPALRPLFRVTTYDLRGHGYSELTASGYTPQEMADDLLGLLDSLGIAKATLIGHSFGADIALLLAAICPERVSRIVALEPGLAALASEGTKPDWPGWQAWIDWLESAGIEIPEDRQADVEFLLEQSVLIPQPPLPGFARKRDLQVQLIRETTLLRDYAKADMLEMDALSRVKTPVLLAYGEDSAFLPAFNYMCTQLPHCQTLLLPGLDHFGVMALPEQLTGPMLKFLQAPDDAAKTDGDSLAVASGG